MNNLNGLNEIGSCNYCSNTLNVFLFVNLYLPGHRKNRKFKIANTALFMVNLVLFFRLHFERMVFMMMFKLNDGRQQKYQQKQDRSNIFKFSNHKNG